MNARTSIEEDALEAVWEWLGEDTVARVTRVAMRWTVAIDAAPDVPPVVIDDARPRGLESAYRRITRTARSDAWADVPPAVRRAARRALDDEAGATYVTVASTPVVIVEVAGTGALIEVCDGRVQPSGVKVGAVRSVAVAVLLYVGVPAALGVQAFAGTRGAWSLETAVAIGAVTAGLTVVALAVAHVAARRGVGRSLLERVGDMLDRRHVR